MSRTVAIVLKGYPRLSETFIAQEIRGLEQRGLSLRIFSLRRPTDRHRHPVHDEIRAPVAYLPEYLYQEPVRVFRAWRAVRNQPGYPYARRLWLKDLMRDPTPNRIRRFGQALVLAHEMAPDVGWIHVHFLHTPASVARYASKICELPWSGSAHAKDIWTSPAWEKKEKLADCRWLVTCTRANAEHLQGLVTDPTRVGLLYHGLDLARFPPPEAVRTRHDGTDADAPVVLLSIGRVVEKKGYDVLLDALVRLPTTLHWRLVHIGGGDGAEAFKRRAVSAKLADRITWKGPQPYDAVLAAYRAADLFVLACRVAADGDRDGLPNVLMEAQSQGLACLSTRLSGIPELIVDGETGLLVPPDDAAALAEGLTHLIGDPALREKLGRAGMERVESAFSRESGIDALAARFGAAEPD